MKETNIESIKTLLNPKETRRKVEPNLNTSNTKLNKAQKKKSSKERLTIDDKDVDRNNVRHHHKGKQKK